jgi:Epiplasmin protein
VPYERTITEYEEVRRQVQVPVTTYVTDYHIVEHAVEYVP